MHNFAERIAEAGTAILEPIVIALCLVSFADALLCSKSTPDGVSCTVPMMDFSMQVRYEQ